MTNPNDETPVYDELGNRVPGDMTGPVGLAFQALADATPRHLNRDELVEEIRAQPPGPGRSSFHERWPIVEDWIENGVHVAVYSNAVANDMHFGVRLLVTFGPDAALGDISPEELPKVHPGLSVRGSDRWKYLLVGYYTG